MVVVVDGCDVFVFVGFDCECVYVMIDYFDGVCFVVFCGCVVWVECVCVVVYDVFVVYDFDEVFFCCYEYDLW